MKKILGLDLGTNSIGWALVEQNFEERKGKIIAVGSRVIPMSQDVLGEFDKGNSISQTAERTRLRSTRRLRERHLLRRERLHRVLNILGFLPKHYAGKIDFDTRLGKFLPETETKLAYDENGKFIFKKSFEEMIADFRTHQPALLRQKNILGTEVKVPYYWTIYYLRKKALTQKIEKEELAWLLLHFNKKRGYHQLRGEDAEERPNKLEEFHSLKIAQVTADVQQQGKAETWYNILLENGWVYRRASKQPLFHWQGSVRDFIVTTEVNEDGSVKIGKDGKEKRSFRSPKEDDWQLLKKKTEYDIEKAEKTVGEFIYDTLLCSPNQKIRGRLIRTIERKYYREELTKILTKQIELHSMLQDKNLYMQCVEELYPHNLQHQASLAERDFVHLFVNDILYYQRPLRSQKGTIRDCPLEFRTFSQEGARKTEPLKCLAASHPLYQEFRIWQWISNLRIINRQSDENETERHLQTPDDFASLFEFLNQRKEIDQKTLLRYFGLKEVGYRWNYVEDKRYPCNETYVMISARLAKVRELPEDFLTVEKETELWHILYSVTDKTEYEKAVKSFAEKNGLDVASFYEAFKKFPPFVASYGAYSSKAIKKLLPLMRAGKYWSEKNLEEHSRNRISRIIDGEFDESIRESVREKANHLTEIHHFQMLPEWLAKYIVYNRHSERAEEGRWTSIADVDRYLRNFRQHSLKNPIVEQVITETLRVVRDIWEKYGNGAEGFFDEIHVELGREMKSPKSVRERIARQNATNADTNLRIRALLAELINDNSVENVRPGSPMQQEILKIFEDGILNSDIEIPHDIQKISRSAYPSTSELQRYKLWMEQKYRSPYTGDIIPLNKLFTPAYEIEHVIPQQRYYDDSLSNKVICESAVNKLKNNQTALEFIQNHHGEVVELGMGKKTRVFSEEEYTDFIGRHFANNPPKKSKLMTLDIPEKMIARQLNDTRYISRLIMQLLSNIVREEKSDEAFNSKNVLATNGQITTKLKKDWGLDAVWNELILARFTRMNEITRRNDFTVYHEKYQKFLPAVPLDQKAFSKKRIDHRHHALDALVIACATRNHINFLNNQHAIDKNKEKAERTRDRQKLKAVLCEKKYNADSEDNYKWTFKQPWEHFMPDCKFALENTIASFKKNTRVVNKTINTYQVLKNGKRDQVRQVKGESWAIRKSLHKDTVSGLIRLRKTKFSSLSAALETPECIVNTQLRRYVQDLIAQGYDKKRLLKHLKESGKSFYGMDISRVEIFYWDNDNVASRVSLDSSFTPAKIGTVTDTGIQKILLSHLAANDNNPEVAFTPEGIEEMNKNIVVLNSGRLHQPILKVRTCEPLGNKFVVGQSGNKASKYVEADKGTNLYFAVYESPEKKRCFDTVPLNIVIERQKQGLSPVPERNEKNYPLAFYLSPNDLIYIPTKEEQEISAMAYTGQLTTEQCRRLYKVVSFTGSRLYAIPCNVATSIVDKVEFTQLNKMERSLEGEMVKETCWKVECNRLGNITKINGRAIQTLTEQGIENIS